MYQLLIVDDESEIREGVAGLFPFEDFGFNVAEIAENGAQALDIIEKRGIDVVLTDIMMPVMDGLELAREINRRELPVIVIIISGYPDFDYARRAIEYNVRKYIVKPAKYADLADVFSALRIELDKKHSEAVQPAAHNADESGYYLQIVEAVKEYINASYGDATLERAAELVHLNPYYLSNVFRLTTGIKFSDHLSRVKMAKAAELLADKALKIHEIGPLVGYANANNFARAFKSFYGKTPSEYRGTIAENPETPLPLGGGGQGA